MKEKMWISTYSQRKYEVGENSMCLRPVTCAHAMQRTPPTQQFVGRHCEKRHGASSQATHSEMWEKKYTHEKLSFATTGEAQQNYEI